MKKVVVMRSCCDRFKNEEHHPECKPKARAAKRPTPKSETVFLVIQEYECRETFVTRESVVDVVKVKEVAEFRANGANMFADVGSKSRCFVRPMQMVCEETTEAYLKNRLR